MTPSIKVSTFMSNLELSDTFVARKVSTYMSVLPLGIHFHVNPALLGASGG
jgi:hypothetical protein